MAAGEPMIEVRGLFKNFGLVRAVDGLDFDLREGEILGFLGPNGAGKTTTINMLIGLARPDTGSIRIAGIDCSGGSTGARHLVGVVPDESNLYPELTGFRNLSFCGALYGMRRKPREERARELLEQFGLESAADRRFGSYSRGMKRRLTIAAGIIHDPPILFLDEPTTGIDVAGARLIRRLILDLNRAGKTVFLTTHYIEEAERLCARISFIVGGRIIRTDTIRNLLLRDDGRRAVHFSLGGEVKGLCEKVSAAFPDLECREEEGKGARVESPGEIRVGPLVRFFEEQGLEIFEARRTRPSLEDVFVRVTGIEASEMEEGGGPARKGGKGKP